MIKTSTICTFLLLLFFGSSFKNETKKDFETFKDDPMKVRIYTLDNGLKIYLSVYKDEPRIQTYIATKAGSKNDPSDATGLAHYLEHMLFKGNDVFGTKDYIKEKPLIDAIENMYEKYRITTDENERKIIYHIIDSLSQEANKYAIANEYDKMMTAIGASGTNAFTSVEQTVYVNNIPSNQIENWLKIESSRFRKPVLRLFHTELEAVYEEKNISLDRDFNQAYELLLQKMFPTFQYGTQTTIGTVEHLKNPSMKKIREYYDTYYVPNNMAIVMVGDFNPDTVYQQIKRNFDSYQKKDIPEFKVTIEKPITQEITGEVFGPDAEAVFIGYRFDGANSKDAQMMELLDAVICNQSSGLIDKNITQNQKVLEAYSFADINKDYCSEILLGRARDGQTLEEVKTLLMAQIDSLKIGAFPDWLLPAIINNKKYENTKALESNNARATEILNTFVWGISWEEHLANEKSITKITKKELVDFAKNYFDNNSPVVIYKRTGTAKDIVKVTKPNITAVAVNRTNQSEFLKEIVDSKVEEIQPVFVDFKKDIQLQKSSKNLSIRYIKNTENNTFKLFYRFEMGKNNNPKLPLAINYLQYLGTDKYTADQIKEEFYKLACNFYNNAGNENSLIYIEGLDENLEKAVEILEHLMANAKPDNEKLANLKSDILKNRSDEKLSKNSILSKLSSYGLYGSKNEANNMLDAKTLEETTSEELCNIIHSLTQYEHTVWFYGSNSDKDLKSILDKHHRLPAKMKSIPAPTKYNLQDVNSNEVYFVNYDMKQAEIIQTTKSVKFDISLIPTIKLYNEYFGGGMGSVVFQELRESRALAYSTYAAYYSPLNKEKYNHYSSYIGTQADKMPEAMLEMQKIVLIMPEDPALLINAKNAIMQKIRTNRTTKDGILYAYENAQKIGIDYQIEKDIYQKVPALTLTDLKIFVQKNLHDKKFNTMVLGNKDDLNFEELKKYGNLHELTLQEIFGY